MKYILFDDCSLSDENLHDVQFRAVIQGKYCEGILKFDEDDWCIYLCQDVVDGDGYAGQHDYKYSWGVYEMDYLEEYDVEDLEILVKMDNITLSRYLTN